MGAARWSRPSFAVAVLTVVAACGGSGDEASAPVPAPSTSGASTSEPVDRPSELSDCDDVPELTTDVVTPAGSEAQDAVVMAVRALWDPTGPESDFAGLWIAGPETRGTVVVAVTRDVERHRATLVDRLGGSDEGFDVIAVEYSQRRLLDVQSLAHPVATELLPQIGASAVRDARNRVMLLADEPVDAEARERLAGALVDAGVDPLRTICLIAPTPEEMPPVIEPGTELDVIVADDAGGVPDDLELACGSQGRFDAGALASPLAPEQLDDAELRSVLDHWLANPEGDQWPQDGWRVLTGDDAAVFVSVDGGQVATVDALRLNGTWTWAGGSLGAGCDVRVLLPDGMGVVEWEVDPSAPAPVPASTEIAVLATERGCASGQPMGDRLLGPQVVETENEVLIAFAAIVQRGAQECPGNPSTHVAIELDALLGNRSIRDGLLVGPIADLIEPAG